MGYQFLTDTDMSASAVWAWAKRLVADLNRDASQQRSAAPVGSLLDYAGSVAPTGWLLCDGALISVATYPALFDVIGHSYGGAGASFAVPDCRNRLRMGAGATVAVAGMAGASSVTLTTPQLPAHSHGVTDPTHTHTLTVDPHTHSLTDPGHAHANGAGSATTGTPGITVGGVGSTASAVTGISVGNTTATAAAAAAATGITTQNTGVGAAISVLNPVIGVNVIIKI